MTNCYFENSADHSYAYSYDNYGNRLEKKAYNNNAVLERYTWTRGRLLERIATGSNATIGQYTYDLNGVRYTKTAGGVTTTYFYDGNTLTGENRSDGKRLRYFYDTTGLCGFSYFNGSNTKYYTYVKDVLGNIVMIKNDMGVPLVRYTYNEWGEATMYALNLDGGAANALETELGNINPFRYRGYYFDTESDLYYLMSRYYDPEIGQFISMDTPDYLAPDTIGGVDLYAYCGYNPIAYVDPLGHFALTTFGIGALIAITLTSMAIGGAMQLVSNALAGQTGDELFRGVVGAAFGAGVNSLVLCLTMPLGGASLFIAAGVSAVVQTGIDTLETLIRKEEVGWSILLDLGLNFITTLVGNYIGDKLVPINKGWFKTQKFFSVFTGSYGQKILTQTSIGAVVSGTINFIRKVDWSKYAPIRMVGILPPPW